MDSVHPQGGQEVAGDTYYLTLNERQAEDTDSSAIGYDTYDATTDTYTSTDCIHLRSRTICRLPAVRRSVRPIAA